MPDWVEEFDNFTPSAATSANPKLSQMEELEQEMKLLHWHKLANEAALKAALIRTRKLKKVEGEDARREALQERAEWMQQIIEDEQAKPLEVDNEFIKDYERREAIEEERLDAEVQRHISCLKKLRQNLKNREETRNRNLKYKMDKQALEQTATGTTQRAPEPESQPKQQISGTLSKVIHSLDKLVDLEKRISNLEHDTQSVGFAKKKTHGNASEPTKTYYAVHVQSKKDRLPRIGGEMAGGIKSQRGAGARMGALPQVKQSQRASRPGNRSSSQKQSKGSQRQDAVIKDWTKKKRAVSNTRPGQRTAVGASSGRKTNNQSMEQFNDIRRDFQKKKDQLARGGQKR
jgi:hypothetical protein